MTFNYPKNGSYIGSDLGAKGKAGMFNLQAAHLYGDGLYGFETFTFTSGTAVLRQGPSLASVLASYDTVTNDWLTDTEFFNVTYLGIQEWTVPKAGTYRIEAVGAAGGHATLGRGQGGKGARIIGDFNLEKGAIVKIAVGQAGNGGADSTNRTDPGGGGGTFVWINDPPNNPLIIAGGGGGVRNFTNDPHGQAGQNASLASPENASTTSLPGQEVAVGEGSWRTSSRYSCCGGGAGWLSEGNCTTRSGSGSQSPEKQNSSSSCGNYGCFGRDLRLDTIRNDGQRMFDSDNQVVNQNEKLWGGFGSCSPNNETANVGGFGGGGGGGCGGEGGGGGYTGGGGTWGNNNHGGGGGSYNGGANQSNTAGYQLGAGYCTITLI